jgi:hypothetical protein
MPSDFRSTPFAQDLLRRMLRRSGRTSPMLPRWQDGLHPEVVAEAERLVDAGPLPLHDYARALNSSQAFALNLFLPFRVGRTDGLAAFLSERLGRRVTVTGVALEYYGSGDLLAEINGANPGPEDRLTQADVAVHLRDADGRPDLLLVEVKLTEGGFTACGGARSRGNRDLGPCDDAATFFDAHARCYLRRPYRASRDRRYWELFARAHGSLREAFPGADEVGPCPFRGDWQQPMRNHALALAAVDAGLGGFWALALVHHDDNPDVVGPWDRTPRPRWTGTTSTAGPPHSSCRRSQTRSPAPILPSRPG